MKHKGFVLIVEDDEDWQEIYEEAFEDEEYFVEIAATKEEAVRKLKARSFDVAIIDLRLDDKDPGNIDGVEVIKWIRANKPSVHPIVKSGYIKSGHLTPEASKLLSKWKIKMMEKDSSVLDLVNQVTQVIHMN